MGPNQKDLFSPELKLKAVMESFQRDATIEEVRRRYSVSKSAINEWRQQFKERGHEVFVFGRRAGKKKPEESPEELKRIIGGLAVQLEILKKAQQLLN